jgi:hypothetical protein
MAECLPGGPLLRSINCVNFNGKYMYRICNIHDFSECGDYKKYDVYYGKYCLTFRDNLTVPSSWIRQSKEIEMEPTGCPEKSITNSQHSVTSHISKGLIYTEAEASNPTKLYRCETLIKNVHIENNRYIIK